MKSIWWEVGDKQLFDVKKNLARALKNTFSPSSVFFLLSTSDNNTIKSGIPEHGITEHGTPGEERNTDGTLAEHWWTTGTLAEQQNTRGTIWIPWNSGTGKHPRNNGTTKQHQKILPMQNNDILSRYHNRIQNKKVNGKVKPIQETVSL